MKQIPLFLRPILILQYSYAMSSEMNPRPAIRFLYEHDLLLIESITSHEWRPDSDTNQKPIESSTYSDTEGDTPTPTAPPTMLPVVPVKSSIQTELTDSIRSKIRALRMIALRPFRKIASEVNIPLTTVYTICQQPSTPRHSRIGRPRPLTTPIRNKLIHYATLSQENRRKPLAQIAEKSRIIVNERTLRQAFADHGYHHRVAPVKPCLNINAKLKRYQWAQLVQTWSAIDFWKVIWTDKSAFNIGGFAGNTWVTRLPGEEYIEACLVPKFRKLETVMVWGCICGHIKGPLVFWNKKEWGSTINGPRYYEYIIHPHLYPFWQEQSQRTLDYVYLMHDGTPPHRAKSTTEVLRQLRILGYFFA